MSVWQQRQLVASLDNKEKINQEVIIAGWINRIRDHGGLTFIDIRDFSGVMQVVLDQEKFAKEIQELAREYVVLVTGKLVARDEANLNKKTPLGQYEVVADKVEILSAAKTPPFDLDTDGSEINEDLRHKYRYLDLRRPRLQNMLKTKHKLFLEFRKWLDEKGFLEVQTPLLTASTPEGARDYLVPSRLQPGHFFALPQSPQVFKQLLMVAGVDKYFQVAPCFRDEDARADRHLGAFYQLDIENAFVDRDTFLDRMEPMFKDVIEQVSQKQVKQYPFPRIPYEEAMTKYGSDKPDIRYGLEHQVVTEELKSSGVKIFANIDYAKALVLNKNEISAEQLEYLSSRKFSDVLNKYVQGFGAPGIGLAVVPEKSADKWSGTLGGAFNEDSRQELTKKLGLSGGEVVVFYGGEVGEVHRIMDTVRRYLAKELKLTNDKELAFAWIIDFPMFEWDENNDKWTYSHNPFSLPSVGKEEISIVDPSEVYTTQYDLACNGYEVAGGSIRNHQPDLLMEVFKILGHPPEKVRDKFGHMLDAFAYGVPPHGGFAVGLERLVMVLLDEDNIRDVYAFPKNASGKEVMTGAPRQVDTDQLKDLGLRLAKGD